MPFPRASKALSRFTVLDLSRVRSGPTCVRQLADWGANVIKIETPANLETGEPLGGPRDGPDFMNLHRNKRSITLNLKSPEGVAAFMKMAKKADVVVENFRPDVKTRLGIDYEILRKINPRLVYASISGFGQDRALCGAARRRPDRPGHGWPDVDHRRAGPRTGARRHPDRRPLRRTVLCHGNSGRVARAGKIRRRSVESTTSLLQAQIFMLDFQAARWLVKGEVAKQAGNDHPTSIPTGVFKTADGHINIATAGQKIWERFCNALDAPGSGRAPRIRQTRPNRSKNRDALNEAIGALHCHNAPAPTGSSASTRPACHAARSTPSTRCSPTRRSSMSASRRPVKHQGQEEAHLCRPAGLAVPHPEQIGGATARPRATHRRRCSRNSDSARKQITALRQADAI